DLLDQVEALDLNILGSRQIDGRGVVDAGVDAAEVLGRSRHCGLDLFLISYIYDEREGSATSLLDLLGSGVDCARQLRVRFSGFRGNGHIGAIARSTQRN